MFKWILIWIPKGEALRPIVLWSNKKWTKSWFISSIPDINLEPFEYITIHLVIFNVSLCLQKKKS